jgi:hypothetical protein
MICCMPHHSKSSGGVERSNWSVENKIGLWMRDIKSQHWSVGLPLVQWEMNTQTHRGIGGGPVQEFLQFFFLAGTLFFQALLIKIKIDRQATKRDLILTMHINRSIALANYHMPINHII